MKAAVLHGAGDIRIEEVSNPIPGSGEVLIRPRYCGRGAGSSRYGLWPVGQERTQRTA